MTDFSSLDLAAPIAKAVAAAGYAIPTPIQSRAIPHVLAGRDLLGIAQTGTGKTAAFALPILDRLHRERRPRPRRGARVLVLAPTRELAGQITDAFRTYGQNLQLSIDAVFGGVSIHHQIKRLESGLDVLVATPGRLIDLIERRALTLRDVEVLVLDEADQMLDLGFIHALRRIIPLLPRERQTLFFSATMPKPIAELADRFLRSPARVAVTPVASTAARVKQHVIFVRQDAKIALLTRTLRELEGVGRALVFTRTKRGADRVASLIAAAGVSAAAIHGDKSQPQRERALEAFRAGRIMVLVATDIAARGIDVDGVSHVINFDMPNVPEQYVHRIGRTARAGATGLAISFVAEDERPYLHDIERLTRQKIAAEKVPVGAIESGPGAGLQLASALPANASGGVAESSARPQKRRRRRRGSRTAPARQAVDRVHA